MLTKNAQGRCPVTIETKPFLHLCPSSHVLHGFIYITQQKVRGLLYKQQLVKIEHKLLSITQAGWWFPSMHGRWYPSMACSREVCYPSMPCSREGCLVWDGVCSRGVPGLRGFAQGGAWWRPSPQMATAAGGTHPTGMHSCY